MRTGSSDIQFQGHRGRIRPDARPKKARKSRNPWFDLEGLESRTLLATIPAATVATINGTATTPVNLTSFPDATATVGGNANSPTVMVNPYDSQQVVAVWAVDISNLSPTPQTTSIIEAAVSTNAGTTWRSLSGVGNVLFDPATSNPEVPYTQVTDPSIGFDSKNDFYVLESQHNGGNTSGTIVLDKFTFTANGGVSQSLNNQPVYFWLPTGDAAYTPTLAVDSGTFPSTMSSPPPNVPADPAVNDVYVAWATNDIAPANPFLYVPFNPNQIQVVSSQDGGNTFTTNVTVNANGNFAPEKESHPQLVIDHNNGGKVIVAWENYGSGATATPPVTSLESNNISPGHVTVDNGAIGPVAPNTTPPNTNGVTTSFPITVNVANPSQINNLTATLAIDVRRASRT